MPSETLLVVAAGITCGRWKEMKLRIRNDEFEALNAVVRWSIPASASAATPIVTRYCACGVRK